MGRIEVLEGDITKMEADAIVNAANNQLQLGGGVAGAIRRAGGPSIQRECNEIGPVELGGAAITGGGDLAAKYVIHAASMHLGGQTTEPNLRSSVRKSLALADENNCKSIAFPAIGAGIAGFPMKRCAQVMKQEIERHLNAGSALEAVYLVLFGEKAYNTFLEVFNP